MHEYNEQQLPRHIAIVMDGNGRWAKRRRLPRIAGHRAGVEIAREIIKNCGEKGVEVLTLFAFSTENWRRPPQEIRALMDLFLRSLQKEANKLQENNVQLRFIGNYQAFEPKLRDKIEEVQALTKHNTGLKLIIAANYGGHWDIVHATQQLAQLVESGKIAAKDINHELFAQHLSMADLPDPDLFIRTSGEQRISNFLNWQIAYTELYFTDVLWPDFKIANLEEALHYYATRQRRFGCTSEQLEVVA